MEQPYSILIIEDDPGVGRSLQKGLEDEGFAVTWKNNGSAGTAHALAAAPHLILLDVRLPDGVGFDFCRQMRQAGLRQPVLMLTVEKEETDKVIGLEVGADDYITKPFSFRELVSRIRAHLRRNYGDYAASHADLLLTTHLAIDLSRGAAQRDGQALNLSPTEFRLLAYLARHPGQALSRQQILEAVWGYLPDIDAEHTVNVTIRRLREKIEPDPSKPSLLLTVPGIGYRLIG